MITLVTGGPGTGKTAFLISQLLEIKKAQPYREFFIHGIRNFTGFVHTTIYCRSPLCDLCTAAEPPEGAYYVEEYPDWFKPHFLIVVDEVQRIWPVKMLAASVEAVSRLQTHRHYGLDFWLISQSPKLIHTDVKAMVGRHLHLVGKWSGRKQYEWPEIRDNINARTDAVERPYKLPKEVFGMYSSAEVHTKQEKRVPLSLYALGITLVIAVLVIGYSIYSIKSRMAPPPVTDGKSAIPVSGSVPVAGDGSGVGDGFKHGSTALVSGRNLLTAMTPAVDGVPWSAPFYDELTKPVSFPQIVGCVEGVKKEVYQCSCYTQQSTVVTVPLSVCQSYIKHRAFNPFIPDSGSVADANGADGSG